jgi:hypothetical protein
VNAVIVVARHGNKVAIWRPHRVHEVLTQSTGYLFDVANLRMGHSTDAHDQGDSHHYLFKTHGMFCKSVFVRERYMHTHAFFDPIVTPKVRNGQLASNLNCIAAKCLTTLFHARSTQLRIRFFGNPYRAL